jgi:SAM-dependent methyltransferase
MDNPSSCEPGYEAFVAEYYDCLPLIQERTDFGFYLDFARRACGPVLELGCGTGRIMLPLAAEGIRITGLDQSPHMLAKCRAKLDSAPAAARQRADLVEGDMTRFDLGRVFHLIIVPFRPFQHLLSLQAQGDCLRESHRHLLPGGKLILDCFHPDPKRLHDPSFLIERELEREILLPDGRKVRRAERTAAFHRAEQTNDVELIYYVSHPDGHAERLVHAFRFRYFFRFEVEHLLARCGFRLVELFGNYDRSPFRDDSPEMLFVAEKC